MSVPRSLPSLFKKGGCGGGVGMVLVVRYVGVGMVDVIMCFGTESRCVAQAALEPAKAPSCQSPES